MIHQSPSQSSSEDNKPPSANSSPGKMRSPGPRSFTPFVWQYGRQLILLDSEPPHWVMAELHFDDDRCQYVEVRRACYEWSGEAIGAALSRALASGEAAVEELAKRINEWLRAQPHYIEWPPTNPPVTAKPDTAR